MKEKKQKKSKVRSQRNTDGDVLGNYSGFLRPRACDARTRKAQKCRAVKSKLERWLERMEAEGITDPVPEAVRYAVDLTGGTAEDYALWMKICNRGLNTFLLAVMDFEFDRERMPHVKLRNPVRALQCRLNRVLPPPVRCRGHLTGGKEA